MGAGELHDGEASMSKQRSGWLSRARVLTASVAVACAMAVPGTAHADTTSLLTVDGVAHDRNGCIELPAEDVGAYLLLLPRHPTREQRDLIRYGIPVGVPIEVQIRPVFEFASYCLNPNMYEVESVTVLG